MVIIERIGAAMTAIIRTPICNGTAVSGIVVEFAVDVLGDTEAEGDDDGLEGIGVTVLPEEVDCCGVGDTFEVEGDGLGVISEESVGVGVTGLLGLVILIDFQYA